MKRTVYIFSAFILILYSTFFSLIIYKNQRVEKVYADTPYLRVITEDTPFYQTQTALTPLFYLPYTYYVKVLSYDENFAHVECYGDGNTPAIDGYVPIDKLFNDNLKVENPFVVLELTTVGTALLYQDSALKIQSQYIFENRSLSYYGHLDTDNGRIYYVSYNDKLGYVKEVDVFPFSIPNHPNELTFITPEVPEEPPQTPQESNENDFFGIKIAIIICLLFAGVIALFVALNKRPEKNLAISYYDDNDYE